MRQFRYPIILDTGPLLTYFCWLFLDDIEASKGQRSEAIASLNLSDLVWNDNSQSILHGIIGTHKCMTTTLVLDEILRLRKNSFLDGFAQDYRTFVLGKVYGFLEICVPLREVADDQLVLQFGLTDAGLLRIAQKYGGTLLTIDTRLYNKLDSEANFDIVLLKDAIES